MDQDSLGPLYAAVLGIALAASITTPRLTWAAEAAPRGRNLSQSLRLHGKKVTDDQGRIQVFVRLDEPAVAELNAQSMESSGKFAPPDAQRAQAARVTEQQTRMKSLIAGQGADILSSQRVAANGLRIRISPAQLGSLRNLPGVLSIGRVEIHTLDNIDSVPWIGAPAAWQLAGKGENVKIGIIDSGIDYTHADFGGPGTSDAYTANNPNVVEPGSFPTAKVKGGWDFAGADYDARIPELSTPAPDGDPLDGDGHGTHVAGTAAGIGVSGIIGSGVAPGADLYALKVLGDARGSTDLTSLAIEWAMDPNGDGDMSDHLDVINMSLGAALGEPGDPSAISSNNAAAAGIIVVTSAGNEGNTPYVTGAPGIARSAISTAALTPGRPHARFAVTAPAAVAGTYALLEGAGPVTVQQAGEITGDLVKGAPLDACAELTNAPQVRGQIAFIIRGNCDFLAKYSHAQNAGAAAIVVYNDGADPDRIDPIVMGGLNDTITIPGLMISSTDGDKLAAVSGTKARIDTASDPTQDDQIADFSSRGPGHGGSSFKPDLSAPGVDIISAQAGSGSGSQTLQGTSMAAPHVAGAAALLRQKYPRLDQSAIKAMLQNSTVNANSSGDTSLARQGVGSVRIDHAIALTSFAAPGGVSFGRLNPLSVMYREKQIKVKNLSDRRRTFNVEHMPNQQYPGVEVSCPSTLTVGPNRRVKATISLRFDPRAAWKQGVFDDATVSQSEVDGWCIFGDGEDTLRVGYMAVVDPASGVLVLPDNGLADVTVRNFGPSIGWAEGFTLANIDGEAQDNTYGSIAALGFRRANPDLYFGLDVLEFGFAMERKFEHLSNLTFTFEVDSNNDGTADVILVGTDLSGFFGQDPGQFGTLQSIDDDLVIDWLPLSWDYNDRVAILPFTLKSSGGSLPEKFSYVLTVTTRSGDQDVQRGEVDLAKEIVPELNSFGLDPNGTVDIKMIGPSGVSLWLMQNNRTESQLAYSLHLQRKSK
jgi:subtilisin family serine protease